QTSSCDDSSFTCCPEASCASATTACSPTAIANSAFPWHRNCSLWMAAIRSPSPRDTPNRAVKWRRHNNNRLASNSPTTTPLLSKLRRFGVLLAPNSHGFSIVSNINHHAFIPDSTIENSDFSTFQTIIRAAQIGKELRAIALNSLRFSSWFQKNNFLARG